MQPSQHFSFTVSGSETQYYFIENASAFEAFFANYPKLVFIVDQALEISFSTYFSSRPVIYMSISEAQKNMASIEQLTEQLLQLDIDKHSLIVGVGGGVLTDMVAYLSAIFMRGLDCCLVPTTILAMVDAAIGGKNGVNVGLYKNMLGTIRQPKSLLYHSAFLETLPEEEWENGFAEVIKYACILDEDLYHALMGSDISLYRSHPDKLNDLLYRCIVHKNKIVQEDELDKGMRRLLNFGHTAGHAFETLYSLKHGHAVALGMIVSLILSEKLGKFGPEIRLQLIALLQRFHLPTSLGFDPQQVMQVLQKDKKREQDYVHFVLMQSWGKAIIEPIPLPLILEALQQFAHESKS